MVWKRKRLYNTERIEGRNSSMHSLSGDNGYDLKWPNLEKGVLKWFPHPHFWGVEIKATPNSQQPQFPATPTPSQGVMTCCDDETWRSSCADGRADTRGHTGCFPLMVCETPPCLPFNTHFLATVRPTHAEERVQNGTEHLAGVGEAVYLFHTWTNSELIWWIL